MKRRPRRPVLDINGEESESPRRRWQNKYQKIAVDHPEQDGLPDNPLASLLGEYNSDSDADDGKPKANKLDDKVNDFLKEIQMIAPGKMARYDSKVSEPVTSPRSHRRSNEIPNCQWQECFDDTTGYPYYWHVETNEVTWEMPTEFKMLRANQKDSTHTNLSSQNAHVHWPNFLPNTYPQLQTNIPEGMIPKEVVARNRNRQVGIPMSQNDQVPVAPEIQKKFGPPDDDTDDEKIEMITSFGDEDSESDASDDGSTVNVTVDQPSVDKQTNQLQKSNANPDIEKIDAVGIKIGPTLPAGIIPMIHGPENIDVDANHADISYRVENQKSSSHKSASSSLTESSNNGEIKEKDISRQLKNQPRGMQARGSQISELLEDVMIHEASADNINSHIEKESSSNQARTITGGVSNITHETNTKQKNSFDERSKPQQKTIQFSLVAGYGDDSDPEEEMSPKKTIAQPLFPIADYNDATEEPNKFTNLQHPVGYDNSTIDNSEIKTLESRAGNNDDADLPSEIQKGTSDEKSNLDIDEAKDGKIIAEVPKINKFLENLEAPAKAFQRKKRIAFDVAPTNRQPEVQSNALPKTDLSNSNSAPSSFDEAERHGFGFSKTAADIENHEDSAENVTTRKQNVESNQSMKSISFVKGETVDLKSEETIKLEEKPKEYNYRIKESSDVVMEKLKFLSEGSPVVSAIQIMAIQLQTLLGAWDSGDLDEKYLFHWLKNTGHELARLECAAAPAGWDCFWDRSHKRYYYRNASTGEVQWNYPEADVAGGTEEMDLCTTPPPPDDEDLTIIEQSKINEADKTKIDNTSAVTTQENSTPKIHVAKVDAVKETTNLEAPPPPQISSPSPPPPPRIYAEDLKKGKRRRTNTNQRCVDAKKEKTDDDKTTPLNTNDRGNPPLPPSPPKVLQPPLPSQPPLIPNSSHNEPLPPGVDPPDMPYSLPAATIEQTLIYAGATRQTNPIYAATIGDRAITVPIIDHHGALIQGQLMHYPTYQHLHNQAMIAAATGLNSQDSVQFMMNDYMQAYRATQVIAKPPIKSQSESLGSALDSFYNDIASIERINAEQEPTEVEISPKERSPPPPPPPPVLPMPVQSTIPVENEQSNTTPDGIGKDKRRKKAKLAIGKKQKEMSTMVAKWQKAQQDFEDSN